jgi:hypothetical protein
MPPNAKSRIGHHARPASAGSRRHRRPRCRSRSACSACRRCTSLASGPAQRHGPVRRQTRPAPAGSSCSRGRNPPAACGGVVRPGAARWTRPARSAPAPHRRSASRWPHCRPSCRRGAWAGWQSAAHFAQAGHSLASAAQASSSAGAAPMRMTAVGLIDGRNSATPPMSITSPSHALLLGDPQAHVGAPASSTGLRPRQAQRRKVREASRRGVARALQRRIRLQGLQGRDGGLGIQRAVVHQTSPRPHPGSAGSRCSGRDCR